MTGARRPTDQSACIPLPVSGDTRVAAVFGFPVAHSLSPAIHNAAFAALGLPWIYVPFLVEPDGLGPALRGAAALGIVGVNLTIPHKERVLPYLDAIDAEASALGAVNTVHMVGGRLTGYNTDGHGFAEPLRRRGVELAAQRAVVIGAGGAARAVVLRLAREGARTVVANRTPSRAAALAADANRIAGREAVEAIDLADAAALRRALVSASLLVNTTSVGMEPREAEELGLPEGVLRPGLLVYDLVYRPETTRLLAAARAAGAETLGGAEMLVHQGAAAFSIWTGQAAPVDVMLRAMSRALAGH